MTEPVGPAHAASRLLVLVLWALAAFTAPALGLVVLAAVSALAGARLPSGARRRWAGAVVKFGPWALLWTVSAWWAARFDIGGLAGAIRVGGATWVAVAGAELLLPGLMPSQVYQTVYDALAWANRRVAEDVAVVAAMMVRFIPLLRAEWQALMWALEVERPGNTPAARVRRAVAALVPLMARALARADTLALVLWLKRPHGPPPDIAAGCNVGGGRGGSVAGEREDGNMAVAMIVAYDGAGFQGFQWQPGVPTVQGTLETALAEVSGGPVRILGASRTDAGVHAMGQVAVWPIETCPIPLDRLGVVVNRRLPPTVRVRQVSVVPASFDPRRSRAKTYSYRVVREPVADPFWVGRVAVTAAPLSLSRLNAWAALFLGRHDFRGFRHQGSSARTTIRQIFSAYWGIESDRWVFWVTGDGFLYHMVRLMVGAMLDAAERGSESRIRDALAFGGRARFAAAPAAGLCLEQVWF